MAEKRGRKRRLILEESSRRNTTREERGLPGFLGRGAAALLTERHADTSYFASGCPLRGPLVILRTDGGHVLLLPFYSLEEARAAVPGIDVRALPLGADLPV